MNVNLFWTSPALAEWRRIDELLAPVGRLFLFYGYGSRRPHRQPGHRRTTDGSTAEARL